MSDLNALIKQFQFERLLKSDTQAKTIALLGRISNEYAIVIIEKSAFNVETLNSHNNTSHLIERISTINSNDVYSWGTALLYQDLEQLPAAKINLIYPATETHVRKYTSQKLHYIRETPEMYQKYVVPYIGTMKGDRIQWVYNILFHGKESESVIYHDKSDEGFVLLPDMKWDNVNLENLYLCCIVNRVDLSSVRDLNGSHAEWLRKVQDKIKTVTNETFGIDPDQLKVFVHYHPSYYHFHLHIVNVHHPGLGDGIAVGKAILLDDIIDNLQLAHDYYEKKTIGFVLGENHGLWQIEGYRKEHSS
ncbi:hypothetical protein CANMA_004299 [Candida margitis]|uniref:uncharacterized protein n=1 Tax=Candida margitis TaxID=1775924 RepID=UPI0022274972|nr:uncharacterized protein CANMA_004299 [Candida margitis]KAI5958145.1 hypothetical protein CANMA_004299 [Candida margitis]